MKNIVNQKLCEPRNRLSIQEGRHVNVYGLILLINLFVSHCFTITSINILYSLFRDNRKSVIGSLNY